MRVLYLITGAELGGAQMHILDLLRGFANVVDPAVGVGQEGYFTAAVRKLGIPCYVVKDLVRPIAPVKDLRALLQVSRLIRHVRADLVHVHTSKAGVLGRLAAKAVGVPSVFTAHTWCFAEGTSWKWRLAGVPAERLAGMVGHAVINVSGANHDLALRNRVCSSKRMVTILNGIPDTPHRAAPDARGVPLVVMVARCMPQKDHSLLMRALAKLSHPAKVRFVGDGPLMPDLKAEARSLMVHDRVDFLGERSDIARVLADASIFALATKWEGFPLSILEGMRAGLPVVASDVGGVAEAVADGETGYLVGCGDTEGFRDRLAALVSNPQLRRRMGQQARRHYEERFRLSRMLDQTYAVYQAAVSGKPVHGQLSGVSGPFNTISAAPLYASEKRFSRQASNL
jgi:glycosyltransferase involved in cell wall biosynthesis